MAPRERGGQGQAAGGRGGGRGTHSGARGPHPNAAAAKKVQDNGNALEKPIPQHQQSLSGSAAAVEPAKPGPWGTSFKDKLMAPKQEAAPAQPAVSAPAAKESSAKPAANGPESAKPASHAAVTAPVAVGAPDNGSDIQFGSFMEGDDAQGKEQPAAPQGPLPTAVPAAVEAVRQQSRQVIRTNSAPASANPAQEGQRDTPVFVPAKVVRAAQQPTRMGVSNPEGTSAAQPIMITDNAPQSIPVASAPIMPVGTAPALLPAREAGQLRPALVQQPSQLDRQPHPRQGSHDRQQHPTGQLPVAHTGGVPISQAQPAGPAPVQHHTGTRHSQQHHMQLAPPQAFAPGPATQPMHHQLPQQQQSGAQGGGRRGGQAHQQVPVQMAVPVAGGFPQAPYGMPSYAAQATPIPMTQPQHGYPTVQHPPVGGPGTGQHGMAGPPQQYLAGSPSQFQPYMFSANPVMGAPLGAPPITVPVMVPVPAHPHTHHPHAAGAPHILASSPTLSVGFHVPGAQQHAPPQANYGTPTNVPQPAPITIPISSAGAGAGSSAPNAPVAAAAQAAINATNAAAPVSAVPTIVSTGPPPQPPPLHAPTATPTPAPAPLQGPGAGAVGGSGVSTAGLPSVAPGGAALTKAVATPPPQPAKKVLQIIDPHSHERVILSGAAGSSDGKTVEGVVAGMLSAVTKTVAAPAAPPPKRPLAIKEPSKSKPEPKLAADAKQVSEMSTPNTSESVKGTATAQSSDLVGDAAQQHAVGHPAAFEVQGLTRAEAAAKPDDMPAAPTAALDAPSPEAALPPKQPSSFQIDVADEEEADVSATSSAQTAAASFQEVPTTADSVVRSVTAEEGAVASASGVTSGSGSGDDSCAAGSTGAGVGTRKKNLKQAIRDADAKGANNDLLSAFREPTPPPKAEAADVVKPKDTTAAEELRAVPAPAPAEEVTEHWEERADEAAAGEASSSATTGNVDTRHRYSRDYLMSIGKQIIMPLSVPLDSYHQQCIGLDSPQDNTRGGVVGMLNRVGSREVDWGRRDDRGRSGDFRGDMRGDRGGGGMGGDRRDRDGMRGGGPSGRGGAGGGMDRRGSANMDDGWQRRGPPPPPSPGGDMRGGSNRGMSRQGSGTAGYGVGAGPVNLHKTENRWQAGISTAEDPEEEKKQKTFKGILNKLTPDNYDKLKQQILSVPITHQKTLEGFINQIFDKALIETTFSEMYANLCKEIHPSLPQFPSNDPNNQKPVDFRRLLLNKCQQEFEDGVAAMKKVKEREEHNKEEAEKEKQGKEKAASASADNGKLEEGEIPGAGTVAAASTEDARVKALAEAAEAERELKARRRMLGNIQFIGQLYKCGLLTERIIHSCIVQLLNDELSPRPDDIECLCKLLTTLGKQLEEQVNKKGTANGNPLDVYFQRMERLRKGSNLDSRIKFAIQDVLDLRAAKWISRRKVEGPKRIEEVHREAQQQMAAQASRDREERYAQQRGPGGRGGPGMGGRDAPPPPGRFGGPSQDEARLMGRGEVPRPLRGAGMERQASSEVNLRPSFLAGKRTGSPAQPGGVIVASAASAREAAAAAVRIQASAAVTVLQAPMREERPAAPPSSAMSEEAARKKGASWVKELYEVKEKVAAADSLAGFKAAGALMGVVLAAALREAFEVRGIDMANRLDFLKELLVEQLTSTEGVLNSSMLEDAFGRFMGELDTWYEDNPKAAGVAAKAVGQLAAQGHISLGPCLRPILDARSIGGDDDDGGAASDLPPLVESGVAGHDILGNVLQAACDAGGADKAAELWRASGLEASRFFDMPEDVEILAGKFAFLSG